MQDLRQTLHYSHYMESIGWSVEFSEGTYAYVRRIPVLGYFIKLQRPHKLNEKFIDDLVTKYKPFKFVVEPSDLPQTELIKKLGFRQMNSYFVPSKTILINCTVSEQELLRSMHYKTRYNIAKSVKSELSVHTSMDIMKFADFWQECALKQRGMFITQKSEIKAIFRSFKGSSEIILVKEGKEILAAILMIYTKSIAYYMYAASSTKGKKSFAPTLAAWSAILAAKKRGCKFFNFEGIYDKRFPVRSWLGFSRFKSSFGGQAVEYPGTFSKSYGLFSFFYRML